MRQDVYSGNVRLEGEEHYSTLLAASNIAHSLIGLGRFEEARSLMRRMVPVARRVLGESDEITLRMRWCYAEALYKDYSATLDDLRESVATLEDVERTIRRIFGSAYPLSTSIEEQLQEARAALRARETPSSKP